MKSHLTISVFCFALKLAHSSSASAATSSDWQGEYSVTVKVDVREDQSPGASWVSNLSVSDCKAGKTCKFSYFSGSAQSDCGAEGELHFKSSTKAEHVENVTTETDDGPRGQCLLTFDRRKNGAIYVDAKDVFKNKKDEEHGNPCNTLCGFQGARYFAIELPKISEKKFYAPSFSCLNGKLTKIETTICTSESLSKIDQDLSDAVAKIKATEPKALAQLTTDQRAWLKTRNSKCSNASDAASCLDEMYRERQIALKQKQGGTSGALNN